MVRHDSKPAKSNQRNSHPIPSALHLQCELYLLVKTRIRTVTPFHGVSNLKLDQYSTHETLALGILKYYNNYGPGAHSLVIKIYLSYCYSLAPDPSLRRTPETFHFTWDSMDRNILSHNEVSHPVKVIPHRVTRSPLQIPQTHPWFILIHCKYECRPARR